MLESYLGRGLVSEELYYDTPRGESMGRHPAGKKLPLKPIEEILERINVKPTQYVRKPFYVDAVQVTLDNMPQVAKWCEGKVIVETPPYIKVRVKRPLAERQTRAFVGDWVLNSGNGYKVYTQSSFEKNFEEVEGKGSMTKALSEQFEFFLGKLDEKLGS
jgi:hypothetical protein